jgi:hypothetical protein
VRSAVDRWKKVQNSRIRMAGLSGGSQAMLVPSIRWACTGGMREHLIHLDRELEIKIPDRRCAMAIDRLLSGASPARMRSDAVSLSGRTAHARS